MGWEWKCCKLGLLLLQDDIVLQIKTLMVWVDWVFYMVISFLLDGRWKIGYWDAMCSAFELCDIFWLRDVFQN